ncbi:unnamed protein product [Fusarium graminearum]|uniref:Chromosome 3, complete genome n=1 Tax=Gibberella zeae (strain ATCC MYA-4620 / CBS 123657 / FGSC 9075 / NRRL 31084 / PH-1) TaxID=229533 RepID=A0A098E1A9_GIBZE|nr:unnamed protein product [Fusarium graminearum]CZS85079.1 unnamed protein product [Fusarium graminearum]
MTGGYDLIANGIGGQRGHSLMQPQTPDSRAPVDSLASDSLLFGAGDLMGPPF